MALAGGLMWLGWMAWVLSDSILGQTWLNPIELKPESGAWQTVIGAGGITDAGFTLTQPGPLGDVKLVIELPDRLEARQFSKVEVRAVERLPDLLGLGWSTSEMLRQISVEPILRLDQVRGVAVLVDNPHWRDGVYFLSIEQAGFADGPWTVQSLYLHREPPEFSELCALIREALFTSDQWVQRNPNSFRPADATLRVSPVLAVAIWVLISFGFMLLLGIRARRTGAVLLMLPVLIGWLLLDLRWQAELIHKAHHTYSTFAAVPASKRFSFDIDGALFDFLDRLKNEHGREEFNRVFAFSEFEFLRKRARFHMASWAVREAPASALTPAVANLLTTGDLILLLDTPEIRIKVLDDQVILSSLDGQALLGGQLILSQREWLALRVL